MLCRRVQKKGKPFSKDETHVHSLHRHLLLPYPKRAGGGWPGVREHDKSEGGCWGGHTSSSKLSPPLPPLPCQGVGTDRQLQAGDQGMGSRRSGKSITLACSACSCDLPATGVSPCLPPPAAQGPGGEMQLVPGFGHDGN